MNPGDSDAPRFATAPADRRGERDLERQLVVITDGLPARPAAKVYQLWLIGPVKIVSAGLLPPARGGRTAPVLASGIVRGDKLRLTVEAGPDGSAQPTTTPILALPLPV